MTGLNASAETFPSQTSKIQPYKANFTKKNVTEFDVECTFQGHYKEPKVNLKVPMEELRALGKIQFNMIYHVNSCVFERVEMLNADGSVIGAATFTTSKATTQAPSVAFAAQASASPNARRASPTNNVAARGNSNAARGGASAARGGSINRTAVKRPVAKTRPGAGGVSMAQARVTTENQANVYENISAQVAQTANQ